MWVGLHPVDQGRWGPEDTSGPQAPHVKAGKLTKNTIAASFVTAKVPSRVSSVDPAIRKASSVSADASTNGAAISAPAIRR